MKRAFIHHPIFRLLAPPVYGVFVYLIILLINNEVGQIRSLFSNQEVYVSIALSLIAFESMRLSIVLLGRRNLPFENRVILQTFMSVVVSLTFVLFAISQYYKWAIGFDISPRELLIFGIIFSFTALLYNALYFGNQYIHRENTQRIEHEHKLRESLESEFTSFRQEINPDLLYDSLEELILCLHKSSDTAEEMIDNLASLYRYQLVNRQKEFVTLSEELSAVANLLRLANQKHHQQIHLANELDNAADILLMPGALVTTIDSVIRNTLISLDSPLELVLSIEDQDYYVLQHKLNDRLQPHPESLEAFQRIQRSYSVYSDRPFIQVKAGRENYIKFPLITVSQSVTEPA